MENPGGVEPITEYELDGHRLTLPVFHRTVRKLCDVVEVDYTLPGCPPTADLLAAAVTAVLEDKLPPRGAVLAPNKALCASCDRNESKPEDVCIEQIRRVVDTELDPETCFLAQGVVCMGPATRDGCGQSCVSGNMPCSGCFGPTDGCRDQGAKMIATLGGILDGDTPRRVARAMEGLVDPAGTFYRYTLSASLVGSARKEQD